MKEYSAQIKIIIAKLNEFGVTNKFIQAGILSKVYTECKFVPQVERSYHNTPSDRLRIIFGSKLKEYTNQQLDVLKKDDIAFFNVIYGGRYGNNTTNDGFKFRGRGWNQLTFKDNYAKYGVIIKEDLLLRPDLVNTIDIASEVLAAFFFDNLKGKDVYKLTTPEEGAFMALRINAGWNTKTDTPFFKNLLAEQNKVVNEFYSLL